MNVLSLFDGMSCGQIALNRLGIKYDKYFASEIDKHAIKVTMSNYPDTIQLGDVTTIDTQKLPKIDLLIGGSPCQSFSFAGRMKGMATKDNQEILTLERYLELKQQGFEFEGQSYLFWEYMRILNEVKPKYFLLENVVMVEKWEKILSKAIGVNPVLINSALVSGQNRERLYWTNIGMQSMGLFGFMESIIQQPKDKKILLKDILQDNPNSIFYLSDRMIDYAFTKSDKYKRKVEFSRLNGKSFPILQSQTQRAGITNYINVDEIQSIDEKYYLTDEQTEKVLDRTKVDINEVDEPAILDVYNKKIKKDNKSITLTDPCHNNLRLIEPVDPKYFVELNESQQKKFVNLNPDPNKSGTLTEAIGRGGSSDEYVAMLKRNSIITHNIPEIVSVRKHEVDITGLQKCLREHKKPVKKISEHLKVPKSMVEHWFRTDDFFSIPDANIWFKLKEYLGIQTDEFDISITEFETKEGVFDKSNRVYDEVGISPTLTSTGADERILTKNRIRKLTPIECERLQTVPDNYTKEVSNSQRYKMLGNGWTVDVICHILSYAKFDE